MLSGFLTQSSSTPLANPILSFGQCKFPARRSTSNTTHRDGSKLLWGFERAQPISAPDLRPTRSKGLVTRSVQRRFPPEVQHSEAD